MAEHLMETTWRTALWRQLGAAIDMLENAPLGLPRPTVERANLSRAPGPPPPSRVRSVLVDHVSRALQARLVSDQRAHRQVTFPCGQGGNSLSFFELQLYGMRHVQEHAAQLSLFLGQHAIPDEALDWVPWAKEKPGS